MRTTHMVCVVAVDGAIVDAPQRLELGGVAHAAREHGCKSGDTMSYREGDGRVKLCCDRPHSVLATCLASCAVASILLH